jgi:DNA polymerase-3 subunit alpha
MFERFLNPDRSDMADFDLDVETNRRDEVIAYANSKWGAWPIANYSTYSHASLIRDIGRFFNVPLNEVAIAAESEDETVLDKFFNKCETTHSTAGVSKKFTPADARRAYDVMLGQIRHRGKHAGGVVIATRPVPIEDEKVAWTEGVHARELSKAGLVKYDILGVTALSQIEEMERISGVTPGNPWDSGAHEVFESIFHTGRTEGVFQFGGSSGIVELTKKVAPKSLADLSAINALYRPGPLDSGMAWKYPEYKAAPRSVHPDIDEILSETYGVIIYQEQVMAIVAKITGGSLADADTARKIISKGKPGDKIWEAKMRALQRHFKDKGYANYPKPLVNSLWDEIVTFGRYGFNKSHSTAYSLVSYRMAWFKHFYPAAFYTALLNGDSENADRWLYAAAQDGIKVKHPDINNSGVFWTTDGVGIYAPLIALKFFGEKQASEFVAYRNEHGKFTTFEQLEKVPKRTINSRVRRQLYLGGALNGITGDIAAYIPAFEETLSMSRAQKEIEALGYRLPGDMFIDFFNKETKLDRVVGFVSEIEKRNKGRGDYYVIRLTPKATFWIRRDLKLNEWDLISVEIGKNGEAVNVWRKRE